jgi:hypothetical protein
MWSFRFLDLRTNRAMASRKMKTRDDAISLARSYERDHSTIYSSQIACARAGSRNVSMYSALTSGPNEPWPNELSVSVSRAGHLQRPVVERAVMKPMPSARTTDARAYRLANRHVSGQR